MPTLDRTLILAPHPDDESIAAGGLLQRVVAANGAARVVFITDGDNNPWPLRYLKKKWRISDADRAEWGALRRDESRRALAALGAFNAEAVFLGYPDRALTSLARNGGAAVESALHAIVEAFAPTLVVIPSSFDLHADHRAIAWFGHRAAAGRDIVTFVVHGTLPQREVAFRIELMPEEAARKRAAIECHHSQLVLSRKRFLSYARDVETFHRAEFDVIRVSSRLEDWRLAMRHAARVVTHRGAE